VLFEVKENMLAAGALGALMSGSGPAVFGISESEGKAEELAVKLMKKYNRVITAKTIDPAILKE
ncbi:MAG: hypothetical protein WCK36_04340, partial [Candidatus Firestonebacteria bacterium]